MTTKSETCSTQKIETPASLRADFMRRWFAIAVSVGFATTVVRMTWVQNGTAPDYSESEQLARLFVALVATVLSWEGYLLSIQRKPLSDIWRYFLDVILVFVYLFLLLTSKFQYFWLSLHATTFVLYAMWDFLTIAMYRDKFLLGGTTSSSIFRVYWGGLFGDSGIDRGPIITLFWGVYFFVLCFMPQKGLPYGTFLFAAFILIGLAGYRVDKMAWRKYPAFSPLVTFGLSICVIIITLTLRRFA